MSNQMQLNDRDERLAERAIIVIDIGKTLAKITLWNQSGVLIERRTRPNARTVHNGTPVLDADGIAAWLAATLSDFAKLAEVGAIMPVAHGAAAAIIRHDHRVGPVFDYESPIPAETRAAYDAIRDPFSETGSPALPDGLNLGIQLYARVLEPGSQILLWPQYWSWLLSGIAASEATSLGCHTDLWRPTDNCPSKIAKKKGWADCLPTLRHAGEALGPITPGWAERTGLRADTQIHCGIHDSNAALIAARGFPEIAEGEETVISTGTWFIAMRTPAEPVDLAALPETRDCLVNVDADGRPIPSARWMGGREIESQIDIDTRRIDIKPDQPALLAAVAGVCEAGTMLLPCFAAGTGPFPDLKGTWINPPDDWFARRSAVCLYAALVTNASLDLIGSKRTILIEGRFAEAEVFVRALASLRPDDAIYTANAHNDVSFGALRLIRPELVPQGILIRVAPLDADIADYHTRWVRATKARSEHIIRDMR
jgi:sugar (pentulose or hexulose) kinase